MDNHQLLNGDNQYTIKNIDTKGKLMWIILEDINTKEKIYLTSHLGLTGFWDFEEGKNDRLKFDIRNKTGSKRFNLYFTDDRNFGNINIYTDKEELNKKIDELAPDSLKDNYTIDDFVDMYIEYASKTAKRKDQELGLVLMNQKKKDGIVSGIGNYLMAEILYHAKLSPYRKIGSLSEKEIRDLGESVQYLTKLSYYDNETGYMTHFDDYIQTHKDDINDGKLPNFHDHIKLKKKDKFEFNVYRQKNDSLGNEVLADKKLQKTRSTYWVPKIQK
jgi:formamidopyrimidine-DNA glycosylase